MVLNEKWRHKTNKCNVGCYCTYGNNGKKGSCEKISISYARDNSIKEVFENEKEKASSKAAYLEIGLRKKCLSSEKMTDNCVDNRQW